MPAPLTSSALSSPTPKRCKLSQTNDRSRTTVSIRANLPLVLFTLLGQAAVGLSWIYGAVGLKESQSLLSLRQALPPFVLISAALLCSAGHLHYPRNSWRALNNWLRSSLSQEALAAALFCALTGFTVLQAIIPSLWPFFNPRILFLLKILLGSTLIFSMARLYMLRTIPVWNRAATPLAFLASTLLLGSVAARIIPEAPAMEPLWLFLCCGMLLRFFSTSRKESSAHLGGAIQTSRHCSPLWWSTLAHATTVASALTLLAISDFFEGGFWIRWPAVLLVLLSEFAARALFYNRHGHDRSLYPPVSPAVSSWRELLESEETESH